MKKLINFLIFCTIMLISIGSNLVFLYCINDLPDSIIAFVSFLIICLFSGAGAAVISDIITEKIRGIE